MNEITQRSRQLRQHQTPEENILWEYLRAKKTGFRIVRQKPILFEFGGAPRAFIADFFCRETRTIIEIDGLIHLNQLDYDQLRTELLAVMKYEVIRFTNDQVMQNVQVVVDSIVSFLRRRREDVAKRQERGEL